MILVELVAGIALAASFTVGGPSPAENEALQATASASETYADFSPQKAVDGRQDTRWSGIPGHNSGVWFQLKWPAPVPIGEVVIHQYERFTHEMDVQVWNGAAGEWRTVRHLGRPGERLPKVIVCSFAPITTSAVRLAEITNGPSFTELEVYARPSPPVVRMASDLRGRFVGVLTDRFGSMPVPGATIRVSARCAGGEWKQETVSGADGIFYCPMPPGLRGEVSVEAASQDAGAATAHFSAAQFPYSLTPLPQGGPVQSLNGVWRFMPDASDGSASPSYNDRAWPKIKVPGHWEMQGFHPSSGRGMYRTRFRLDRITGRVKLRFDGVYSGASVWVNGRLVAYHEGGFTPFETDITSAVTAGENVLAVGVAEHTVTSDELDKASLYADFPLGGILRDVTLFQVPEVHAASVEVAARFDKAYRDAFLNGFVAIVNEGPRNWGDAVVRMSLELPGGRPVPIDAPPQHVHITPWSRVDVPIAIRCKAPKKWDAEHPNLYSLHISLERTPGAASAPSGGAHPREFDLRMPVGFRQTEIDGTRILINGRPVKLRGTCHHDSHPTMGRAVSAGLTRHDVEMIKQANLNAVRTSHYPPHPELISAADEAGLYVEDEAPFCWVSAADDLRLAPHIVQLTAELVARDRNHPSVFLWSLCNESEFGRSFQASHEWIRNADPSRPTSAATSADLEVATLHNPITVARIAENEGRKQPLIFDESFCVFQGIFGDAGEMWVDPGIRDAYVEPLGAIYRRFMESRVTCGSMIWCWADDIFCVPGRGLEYGRGATRVHWLETNYRLPGRGLVGDAPWGIVDGWRRPKPEYWIVRKLHSPIKIPEQVLPLPKRGEPLRVPVTNEFDFTDLAEIEGDWSVGTEQGTLKMHVAPHSSGELAIMPRHSPTAGEVLVLNFYRSDGTAIDTYRLPIGRAETEQPAVERPSGTVRVREEGSYPDFQGSYEWEITAEGAITVHAAFVYGGPDLWVREVGMRFSVPRDCNVLEWMRHAEWSVYPPDHIGRPRGTAAAFPRHASGAPPAWSWSADITPMGSNDFRSSKRRVLWAAIRYPAGAGILVQCTGTQAVRANVEADRVAVYVNDWYGGTGAGWTEWESNYGRGRLLRHGDRLEAVLRMEIVRFRNHVR
ncbi:MAG: glycoside hydrolase family 2 TIM barrel-domain containing protein [Chthonomonadales bacterium]